MIIKRLTPDEADLIEMIRNLRKAFPNGYEEMLYECQRLFDKLIETPMD